jgi:hypothetical protein
MLADEQDYQMRAGDAGELLVRSQDPWRLIPVHRQPANLRPFTSGGSAATRFVLVCGKSKPPG